MNLIELKSLTCNLNNHLLNLFSYYFIILKNYKDPSNGTTEGSLLNYAFINFAQPVCCEWLHNLAPEAKSLGMLRKRWLPSDEHKAVSW